MWPPMPGSFLFWRCTIAIAFQRIRLLMRRSNCAVAGIRHFLFDGDGVDVGRIELHRHFHARLARPLHQRFQQVAAATRAFLVDHLVERLKPFGNFFFGVHLRVRGKFQNARRKFLCGHRYLESSEIV